MTAAAITTDAVTQWWSTTLRRIYRWRNANCRITSPLPPQGKGIGYTVVVRNGQQHVYDALRATGALNDPRHSGRARNVDVEAPAA